MEIEITGENEITLTGNIKSLKDYQNIKTTISDMITAGAPRIVIRTPESFSITSSVIGFLMKVIFQDHVKVTLFVRDPRLYSILEDLQLIETFNVIRTEN